MFLSSRDKDTNTVREIIIAEIIKILDSKKPYITPPTTSPIILATAPPLPA